MTLQCFMPQLGACVRGWAEPVPEGIQTQQVDRVRAAGGPWVQPGRDQGPSSLTADAGPCMR